MAAVRHPAIFGDNFARMRGGADMSQDELTLLCGIHRTENSQLERDPRIPVWTRSPMICSSLEVEPGELMAGTIWRSARIEHGSIDPGAEGPSLTLDAAPPSSRWMDTVLVRVTATWENAPQAVRVF